MNALPWLSATGKSLLALNQTRASIFQTAFNPTGVRTGAKYLRRRLRGPSMLRYYPEPISMAKIVRQYPQLEMVDEDEQIRFEDVEYRKKRGKGAPKKARTAGESRRAGKKR